jgi:peptide/nickel transport system substrate-binding protein
MPLDRLLPRRSMIGRPLLAAVALSCLGMSSAALAQAPRNHATLAMVGEPQTLDPMASTSDLVTTIMQHVYETLFTFDLKGNVVPMLATTLPKVSADGKVYTITLRQGVMLHNGRELNADDVVASVDRWLKQSPRGKSVARVLENMKTVGAHGVELTLKEPYAPLTSLLAMTGTIMAKDSIAQPLVNYVGTGPYRFVERKPDQFVLLTRFDKYSSRTEPASGRAGKKVALIEQLRFVPVPSASTRVEGALAGQYDFADQLPLESLDRLEKAKGKVEPLIMPSFGFPYLVLNTKEGVSANQGVRQAMQIAMGPGEMLAAGFGDIRFFAVEANHFPKGSPYFSEAGAASYNQRNANAAKAAAEKAGYKGEAVRILVSRQYDFHYNMAVLMAEQFKRAGFKAELNVVDWATLIQRRNDSKLWDLYVTHSGLLPEPMLSPPQLGEGAPGWWSTPAKDASLAAFNREANPARRAALWGKVQQVVYDEVPYINVGKFSSLSAKSPALQGYVASTWPSFWNTSIK